jgi:hypothetical protein
MGERRGGGGPWVRQCNAMHRRRERRQVRKQVGQSWTVTVVVDGQEPRPPMRSSGE